jgi:hypothetical protein
MSLEEHSLNTKDGTYLGYVLQELKICGIYGFWDGTGMIVDIEL